VQPYTHDKPTLLAAVERATKGNSLLKSGTLASTILMNPNPGSVTTNTAGVAATSAPNANSLAQPAFDPRDAQFARNLAGLDASMGLDTGLRTEAELQTRLRFMDSIATGMTILDEMRELIHSQSRLPGRKVVLYLSDGLQLPPDRRRAFDAVVSDANRSGVTFYTVDTRGLTGPQDNPINASVTQLNRAVAESQQGRALMQGQLSGGTAFDAGRATDDVQLLAVSNTQLALQELAVRTGGFAVANTNELAKPMERVMEDIRTHYELAYAPASEVYDGHFRKITIKLDRPKSTVQTRSGYYALPDLNGEPLQSFEVTALKAMNARPAPYQVPYDTALMQFRPDQNAMECEVAFEVPIAGLTIAPDQKTGKARIQASVIALIQDANGQVVGKVSRQFFRTILNSDVKAIQAEKIEYAEPVELAPGHYTLATAVIDGESNAIAAKRVATFIKPAAQLGLSSLEVVKRITALLGERNPVDPLEMQNGRVTVTWTAMLLLRANQSICTSLSIPISARRASRQSC
jgi:VWFA-related protein